MSSQVKRNVIAFAVNAVASRTGAELAFTQQKP
jgi:enoyl-[acyl-carrier-protein] reductase (NADH)